MKQAELKKLVGAAIDRSNKNVAALIDTDNPQVLGLKQAHLVQAQALNAVLDALNNNPVMLRIMGECN